LLQQRGATIIAYDPKGRPQAEPLLPGITWASDAFAALRGADAAVVLTEWAEFRSLDLAAVKSAMRTPVLADFRNIYAPEAARNLGFTYESIGRPDRHRA
jgi:UDPglucose 6-dehydrogenase